MERPKISYDHSWIMMMCLRVSERCPLKLLKFVGVVQITFLQIEVDVVGVSASHTHLSCNPYDINLPESAPYFYDTNYRY